MIDDFCGLSVMMGDFYSLLMASGKAETVSRPTGLSRGDESPLNWGYQVTHDKTMTKNISSAARMGSFHAMKAIATKMGHFCSLSVV